LAIFISIAINTSHNYDKLSKIKRMKYITFLFFTAYFSLSCAAQSQRGFYGEVKINHARAYNLSELGNILSSTGFQASRINIFDESYLQVKNINLGLGYKFKNNFSLKFEYGTNTFGTSISGTITTVDDSGSTFVSTSNRINSKIRAKYFGFNFGKSIKVKNAFIFFDLGFSYQKNSTYNSFISIPELRKNAINIKSSIGSEIPVSESFSLTSNIIISKPFFYGDSNNFFLVDYEGEGGYSPLIFGLELGGRIYF